MPTVIYHYTYFITNTTNQMQYIGVRSCSCLPENDSDYMGSSKTLDETMAVEPEAFTKTIIGTFPTREIANDDDIILVNDIDEIPDFNGINFSYIKNRITFFQQKIFCYKFNLLYKDLIWYGSRTCKKKKLLSPQWLRNIKPKKYPIWRFDILFSRKKYNNINFIQNGGWHFTNIKSPVDLEKKFSHFLHHQDFEASGLKLKDIKEKVKNKKILYDLDVDQRDYKWSGIKSLTKVPLSEMPDYLSNNYRKYSDWLDN